MQNSSVYYTVALIPASGCKKWPILENSKFRAARPPWIPTLSFYKKSEAEGVKKNLEHVLKLAPTPRKTLFFLLLSRAFSSLLYQLTGKNRKIKFCAHSAENESLDFRSVRSRLKFKNFGFSLHQRLPLVQIYWSLQKIWPESAPPDLYLPQKKISSYVQNRADLRFLLGQNTENFGKLQKRDQISFTFMHLIIFSSLFPLSEDEQNQKLLVLDIWANFFLASRIPTQNWTR